MTLGTSLPSIGDRMLGPTSEQVLQCFLFSVLKFVGLFFTSFVYSVHRRAM